MSQRTRNWMAVVAVIGLGGSPLAAADKKDAKPTLSGVWAQKGGMRITFDKDVMKVSPHGDNEVVVLVCKYTVEKGGVVKAKVTDVEAADDIKAKVRETVPDGLEFTFKWEAKDGKATLDDVTGEKSDGIKARLEGEYTLKKND
jgi:hypothetical protein